MIGSLYNMICPTERAVARGIARAHDTDASGKKLTPYFGHRAIFVIFLSFRERETVL